MGRRLLPKLEARLFEGYYTAAAAGVGHADGRIGSGFIKRP
jgi:hypothetical protein